MSFRLEKMNSSIEHRGNDSSGVYSNSFVGLGHQRLSIVDLSETGHQPMTSNNGTWTIVFNGEIYNHSDIRNEIKGYRFAGTSDTETIVAALDLHGVEWFLKRANGMFAIAAFNNVDKRLYLLRDRMGIKPLFYFIDGESIVFSSEIKGILSSGLVEADFNERAVDDYLSYRYVREPNTMFKRINQVRSSHYLTIDASLEVFESRYWTLPTEFNMDEDYDESEILKKLDIELNKSVERRLMSDVPLGSYLSGGVDSSLLTAIVQKHTTEPVCTYNIGFDSMNEFEYARIIANQYKTDHHEIVLEQNDYFNNWKELIKYKDAPLAVPNEIPLSIMSSELKKKITVVLSGEGADELFGGYGRIFRSYYDYLNGEGTSSFVEQFRSKYEYISRELRDSILKNSDGYRKEFDEEITSLFDSCSGEEFIFRFFHTYHIKGLLQRVDMSTMQATVEARVPFLDHELIEFVYKNVPYDMKLRWNSDTAAEQAMCKSSNQYSEVLDTPKYGLKKLSYNYIDARVIERKKVGFPVPLNDWLGDLEEMVKEYLFDAPWIKGQKEIENLIERAQNEDRAGQILWMLLNVELFRGAYFNKTWKW